MFYALTCLYLELSPTLSLFNLTSPGAAGHASAFVALIIASLLLFQIPMLAIYSRLTRTNAAAPELQPRTVSSLGSTIFAIGSLLLAALFLYIIQRYGLRYARIGGDGAAEALIGLPTWVFAVFRLYQTNVLFIIAVLFLLRHFSGDVGGRQLFSLAITANVGVWTYFCIINSRGGLLNLTILVLAGYVLRRRQNSATIGSIAISTIILGLGYILIVGSVNYRLYATGGDLQRSYFTQLDTRATGDEQGTERLDCIDLIAQITPRLNDEGPALGRAWEPYTWLVRRYTDPAGFDRFRRNLKTTAKSYLGDEYLDKSFTDYYSCTLTDLYGNFAAAGFVIGAIIFALGFAFLRRVLFVGSRAWVFMLGLWLMPRLLLFDQEAGNLLFGWITQIPFIIAFLLCGPFSEQTTPARPVPHEGRYGTIPA